jgi:cellulose biosynthesis protein BcsQ
MNIFIPRWLVLVFVTSVCLFVTGAIYFWEAVSAFVSAYEPQLKIISLLLGPIATVASVYWGYKSKLDLVEHGARLAAETAQKSEELGRLSNEVDNAHASNREKEEELARAAAIIEDRERKVQKLQNDLRQITEGAQELWKLRAVRSFPDYLNWHRDPNGAKLITIGNLKGGVGKTTIAANLAAYISETRNEPVLLVDLDYQGSLSNMLMLAIEREEVESKVDRLFSPDANLITLEGAKEHLTPKLNRGWLVPANYSFAQVENQLLLKWLLQEEGSIDVRFRLAHALLRPEIRKSYAAIIFDMPPRMTLGAINALVASHYFIVPTMLDKLAAEAVGQFISNMKAIKRDLGLDLKLAGIIGCMTRQASPSPREEQARELARQGGYVWREDKDYVFATTIPRRVDIGNAAGEDVAYCVREGLRYPNRDIFDPLFKEICAEIFTEN